jgi:rhomboid family GlyGly-CTERM serine protease
MKTARPVGGFKGLIASVNGDGPRGLVLAAILALLLLLQLGGAATASALRYDRSAVLAGQWWRLASAHLVHLDLRHALLNGLGLVLMWALFVRDYRGRQWFLILLAAAAAIDAGLWFRDTSVLWYVGASGVLHGVMAAGILAELRRGELAGLVLAVFLLAKLTYEQWAGALPFAGPAVPVMVNAHLYGALGGLAAALWMRPLPERL